MELPQHFKNLIKKSQSLLENFLETNPAFLSDLSPVHQDAFFKICRSVTHRNARNANIFFQNIHQHLKNAEGNRYCGLIVGGALRVSELHCVLVTRYFSAVRALPQNEDFLERWSALAYDLGRLDVAVAATFIELSPPAVETFGDENFFHWGDISLEWLAAETGNWKIARAFLKATVADQGGTSLQRWKFYLAQASRIAKISVLAGETFIESCARVCLSLNDRETVQWIDSGLEGYKKKKTKGFQPKKLNVHLQAEGGKTDEDLVHYFSGTSQKALEKRDGISSGIALKARRNTLALICEGYLGRKVRIRSNTTLSMYKGFTGGAATDGQTVYLPDTVSEFTLFKLMALHQTALMDLDVWSAGCGKKPFHPFEIHTIADGILLGKLPGLIKDMKKFSDGDRPTGCPGRFHEAQFEPPPWWGDILPGLVKETRSIITKLKERAADHTELSPEMIEGVATNMIADGKRDFDELWSRLMEIFDTKIYSPDPEELEENFKTFFYKEWDANIFDYKMDWCLVRQRFVKDDPNDFVSEVRNRLQGAIHLIRKQFARLRPERFKKYRAQPYGDALDIDALIQSIVDMRSGSFLSENVFVRRDKRLRDVAVLFLLDMSGSTEERIQGRRIIDTQKEAMVLMAEALESLGDTYAMYGFSSEGRFRVDFFNIKEFQEPYNKQVRYRLGNVQPLEMTRMGAILRHATHKFDTISAAVKLMILLTDGRPYDYEYANLSYAVADTKNAIQEVRRHHIHPFIITSDRKGASYLRKISPQTRSIVLRKVELLPTMLPAIYKRLTV